MKKTLNIALIGYGKMGHIIEKIAIVRGHKVVCRIDRDNTDDFYTPEFKSADVAIEFSTPTTAFHNLKHCLEAGVPVVCGTTGWLDKLPEIQNLISATDGAMLYGSNFSVGVNVFMALNRYLAAIMNNFPQYTAELTETHHIHKLDHPSGTAITLADDLVKYVDRIEKWAEPCSSPITNSDLPLNFIRRGEVPGIHTITWDSAPDSITITHSARSRDGFALGAVMAAEWLPGHHGFFNVGNMLADLTGLKKIFEQ